jgi:hypothetical protein
MMIMIAAAVAAAAPAAPSPPADVHAQHQGMAGINMQHEAKKDGCCCEHMAGKHDDAGHEEHGGDHAG